MSWFSVVFLLVTLLQSNALAAEGYLGNNRNWNSRDLNLRRPIQANSNPGSVIQPIHSLPRPLPKPIEIPKVVEENPSTTIVYAENQATEAPFEQPSGRSFGARRFNLQRRPLPGSRPVPQPIAVAPVPVPQPIAIASVPVPVNPEPVAITPEPAPEPAALKDEEINSVPEPPIAVPQPAPLNVAESTEDIEIITRAPISRYLTPKPLPPLRITTIPEVVSTAEPIRSVTIINEPEPIEISTPREVTWSPSTPAEPAVTIIESSSPIDEMEVDIEDDQPEVIETSTTLRAINVQRPTTFAVEDNRPKSLSSAPLRPGLRRRRPITRKPSQPAVLPRVTPKPPRAIPPAPKPRPIPPVTPTKPPVVNKPYIPKAKTIPDAPIELMDYKCGLANAFYSVSNECDTYVECQNFIAMRSICPDGLHFDPRAIWPEYPCAYPSEVRCESNSIRQKSQPTADCPSRYGFFPVSDTDCSRYMMCQEGGATIMDCPPGLVFNVDTSTCDWPANVPSCKPEVFRGFTCPEPPLEEDGTPSDMIFKYKYNQSCKEYVACQLGHPRLLRCDAGLSFDELSELCIDSDLVPNCSEYL